VTLRPPRLQPRVVLIQTQAEGAGAQEISRLLGMGLERHGYEIHHVFFFRRTAAFDAQPNVFFCVRERPRGLAALHAMWSELVRHLRALDPDAVLCFQHYGIVIGTLAARAAGVSAVIANRTSSKRQEAFWLRSLDLAFGFTGLFRRMVVNSAVMAEEYASYPERYRDRIVRIDHGFEPKRSELSRADAREQFDLPRDARLLGCVARLHADKQLDRIVRLIAGEPTWHFAIAGQGPAEPDLRLLAADLGVRERLHFVGELTSDGVATFLRGLDAFVFPSRIETFGLAAVEAAQAGVPVVANDLEVLREVLAVEGEPCALFADAGDPKAFGAAVRLVLDDVALRTRLGARGIALIRRYSLDKMVARYADLVAEVVRRHAGAAPP
jgi:glycosyltransferase involved in cell wall biosynthesis